MDAVESYQALDHGLDLTRPLSQGARAVERHLQFRCRPPAGREERSRKAELQCEFLTVPVETLGKLLEQRQGP